MMMVGRKYGALGRYGFNGKEQDSELKEIGTQYDYGFRIYDPRLGRFLRVDPLTRSYPWFTPYQFAGNMPIIAIDLDGLEALIKTIIHGTENRVIFQTQKYYENAENVENGHWEIHIYYKFEKGKQPQILRQEKFKVFEQTPEVKNSTGTINLSNPSLSNTTMAFGSLVSPEFRTKAMQVSENLGMDVNHLMTIMAFETGNSFSPSKKNAAGSSGTGLIQFMSFTAKRLGTTVDALSKMTAIEQLDYVEKYFQDYKGKLNTLEDAYMAVLWPAAAGKELDYVLWNQFKTVNGEQKETLEYKQNSGLDTDHDGKITKNEVSVIIRNKLKQGEKKKNKTL